MTKVQTNSQGKVYVVNGKALLSSGGGGTIDSLTITPTTSSQTITASGGVDGYSPITVNAVTSSIDANITAGNIKSGVSILGVMGNYSGGGSDTVPSYQITSGALTRKTDTYNLTGTEFSNVTSIGNNGLHYVFYGCSGITGSVNLSNVTSIGTYGLYYAFRGCTGITGSIDLSNVTSIGTDGLNYAFYYCTGITGSIDLSNLTSVETRALTNAFYNCTGLTSVDLSSATSIGNSGLSSAFYNCTGITSVDLSSVTSIGTNGLSFAFYGCTGLTGSIDLGSVTSIASGGLNYAFYDCKKLQTINFDSLTTSSFGNVNAFNSMFSNTTGSEATGGCTVHFPSNLQSTISGLTGYPTFGGNSSYITLSFDLPATS